jgi:hypothetical protein
VKWDMMLCNFHSFFPSTLLIPFLLCLMISLTAFPEDFRSTKVVTRRAKFLCVLAIVASNLFCLYYALLKGYSRGVEWQRAYLMGAVSQIVVEIGLFESMEW